MNTGLCSAGVALALLAATLLTGRAEETGAGEQPSPARPAPATGGSGQPGSATPKQEASVIYVSGAVRVAGTQEIVAGETLTLTKVILNAGGIGEWGDARKVRITRQNGEIFFVDLWKIIKTGDAKDDPVLQAGDRIFVPKKFIGP